MENERGQPQQVSLTHPKRMRFARFLRDWPLHIAAVILIVAVLIIAPRQAGILVYKASLLLIAAIGAYWINRTLFHRLGHGCEEQNIHHQYQLVIMVAAAMIAAGLAA